MIKAGIIGHPVDHSKSPIIHNTWIKQYGLKGRYEALDITPENLPKQLPRLLREEGYSGFNLTIPHKEAALDLCDEIDDIARAVGAVNTVFIHKNKICGTNTDVYGFVHNIKKSRPDFNFAEGRSVILGAGGAARAVLRGLLQEGAPKITLINRTREKAEALAQIDPRIEVLDWREREKALKDAHFLVNATPLGMAGQRPLDLDLRELPLGALVSDVVYVPLRTALLNQAQKKGNRTVNGLGMLLYQAAPAFQSWFGILPSVDKTVTQKVLETL